MSRRTLGSARSGAGGGASPVGYGGRPRSRGPSVPGSAAHPSGPAANDYDVLSPACPSRTVLRHVVDRWTPLIVAVLLEGSHRFGELRSAIGGITPKVLTETLRSMERDGLVTRDQVPGVPPRVDYALTPLGATLAVPMAALRNWAQDHCAEVLANRVRYDGATPGPVVPHR